MASTPKSDDVVSLNDSWIDINENTYSPSDTPFHLSVKNNNSKNNNGPTTLQSLEKLLLDAQKESQTGHSSLKGSFLGSLPITPDGLQTPPNSIYFNNNEHVERNPLSTDWIWDWSNRDPLSKEWSNIQTNRNSRPTFRQWIIRRGILSKEVLSLLFLTNVLSLILGAGIGYTIIIRKTF